MRALLVCLSILLLVPGCVGGPSPAEEGAVSTAGARINPPVGSWRLVAFASSDAAVTSVVTLVVQEDGRIGGSGGCNGYFGRWTLGEGQDTLGPVGATRKMCAPDVMAIESRYFETLARVGGWQPTDRGLLLTDAAGDALLSFVRE